MQSRTLKLTVIVGAVSAILAGCSSTSTSYTLVSKHPKAISADVIPALMKTAKARCTAQGGEIQYDDIDQRRDVTSETGGIRSVLHYTCFVKEKPKNEVKEEEPPSPSVRDLARRNTESIAPVSTQSREILRPTETQIPTRQVELHPNVDRPTSAEWPTYSDQLGEPAGILPSPEQIAYLEQAPNLEKQNVATERKHHAVRKTDLKTPKKVSKPVPKEETSSKSESFNSEVDALKAKAKNILKQKASKPIEKKPVVQIEGKPLTLNEKSVAKALTKTQEKLESAGYAGRPITEEVW